ncbi:MAG: TolC family protein [Pirellulales bacterium]
MDDHAIERRSPLPPLRRRVARVVTLLVLLCIGVVCAGGCATSLRDWARNGFKVGPNYVRPPAPVAPHWIEDGNPLVHNDPPSDCGWWTVFRDPTLNTLVDMAYRQNLDVRVAGTRILQARSQRNISVGNLFPQSQSAMAAYAHGQITENLNVPVPSSFNVWATGFNASWELDFWGRYRRTVEASNADLAGSVEQYGDTLILVLAEVATAYVDLRTFEQRLDYAQQNVQIQLGTLKLAEARFERGLATELDVRQARSSLAQTEASIPQFEISRRQASNRLCTLLGMPVGDLAAQFAKAPIPVAPPEVAIGLPAELLRRRPDIRQAEREVAAQSARIGVAEADLYPSLSLNGFLGYAADDIERLFRSSSFTAFIIPTLNWNVLNYGRIANNIRLQDARLEGAALEYQQTVLRAGQEVEDALVSYLQSQRRAAKLAESVREAERSVELVLVQYRGGVTDFNRVFNTQELLVSQQDQFAAAEGEIAQSLIRVYKALGGGWLYFCRGQGMPRLQAVETEVPPRQTPSDVPREALPPAPPVIEPTPTPSPAAPAPVSPVPGPAAPLPAGPTPAAPSPQSESEPDLPG